MHPLIAIPVALLGFLFGRATSGGRGKVTGSPISGVSQDAWAAFVTGMVVASKDAVGRRGKLGVFQMDARRLTDVGAMTRAWKGKRGAEDGVWLGEWSKGLTEKAFLGSMPLQYAVFVRSMAAMAPKVSPLVGSPVDLKISSLSGLLGVGHVAGERGVAGFVAEPEVRGRFPATVAAFDRTNGIF